MPDDSPLTYRDVATILALIDGPQRGKLTLVQDDMEIHVEKAGAAESSTLETTPVSPAKDT